MVKPSQQEKAMPQLVDRIIRENEYEIREYIARNPSPKDAKRFAEKIARSETKQSNFGWVAAVLTSFFQANPAKDETIEVGFPKIGPPANKRRPGRGIYPTSGKHNALPKRGTKKSVDIRVKLSPYQRDVLRGTKADDAPTKTTKISSQNQRPLSREEVIALLMGMRVDSPAQRNSTKGDSSKPLEIIEKEKDSGYPEDLKEIKPRQADVTHAPSAGVLQQGLVDQFQAAIDAMGLQAAKEFVQGLLDQTFDAGPSLPEGFPKEAPELFNKRKKRDMGDKFRKENPSEFIERVYGQWLGPDDRWPRKVLDDLDPPLYIAISRYKLTPELDAKLYKTAGRRRKPTSENDLAVLERKRERDREASKRYYAKNKM